MAGPERYLYLPLGTQDNPTPGNLVESPCYHHRGLQRDERELHRRCGGHHLAKSSSFRTPCAKQELVLHVQLETPESAERLLPKVEKLASDMHGMELLLLETYVNRDYGDDLLLLTATDESTDQLVGMIFWRYLPRASDDFWRRVNVDWRAAAAVSAHAETGTELDVLGPQSPSSWTLIELLCTDRGYRGHGVGKLLLVAALAYSAVKDGKTAAVLIVGQSETDVARELYSKLGFEELPEQLFIPRDSPKAGLSWQGHVMVSWDLRRSLRSLRLSDVDGSRRGTCVPQLKETAAAAGDGDDDGALVRLDSAGAAAMVERLTMEEDSGSGCRQGGPAAVADAAALRPGTVVRVAGLQSARGLNGCLGRCEELDAKNGRWVVRFASGDAKSIRPANLLPLDPRQECTV